jgi:hypothetical protein
MNAQKLLASVTLAAALVCASTAQAQLLGGGGSIGGALSGGMANGVLSGSGSGGFGAMGALDSRWVHDGADNATTGTRDAATRASKAATNEGSRGKSAVENTGQRAKSGVGNLASEADGAASGSATAAGSGAAATRNAAGTASAGSAAKPAANGNPGSASILGTTDVQRQPALRDDASASEHQSVGDRHVAGSGNADATVQKSGASYSAGAADAGTARADQNH